MESLALLFSVLVITVTLSPEFSSILLWQFLIFLIQNVYVENPFRILLWNHNGMLTFENELTVWLWDQYIDIALLKLICSNRNILKLTYYLAYRPSILMVELKMVPLSSSGQIFSTTSSSNSLWLPSSYSYGPSHSNHTYYGISIVLSSWETYYCNPI